MNTECSDNGNWLHESLKLALFFVLFAALCMGLYVFGRSVAHTSAPYGSLVSSAVRSKNPTIVIDPGHGGFDGGAVSETGACEKDINLSVARYLSSFFSIGGYDVAMTRQDDRLLTSPNHTESKKRSDLFGRVEYANRYENPVFISIHQNKFEISKYKGLQVYYSKNAAESEAIAKNIQRYVKELLQTENRREAKAAGSSILVLDKLKNPAVLVECGFLSNPEEASLLSESSYQRKLALVIYLAVDECLRKTDMRE